MKGVGGAMFTAYVIEVTRAEGAVRSITWEVAKRFSDVVDFRAAWLAKLKGATKGRVSDLPFPSKLSIGGSDAVAARCRALEKWLKTLLSLSIAIRWHSDLLLFLGARTVCPGGVSPEGMPRAVDVPVPVALTRPAYPPCCNSTTTAAFLLKEGILKKMAISQIKAKNWTKRHVRLFWVSADSSAAPKAAGSLALAYYAPGETPSLAKAAAQQGRVDAPRGMIYLGGMAHAQRCAAIGSRKFPFEVRVATADGCVSRRYLFNADLSTIASQWCDCINAFSGALRPSTDAAQAAPSIAAASASAPPTAADIAALAAVSEKVRAKVAGAVHASLAPGSAPLSLRKTKAGQRNKTLLAVLRYRLHVWGRNDGGQLANGDMGTNKSAPTEVAFFGGGRKLNEPAIIAVGPSTMAAVTINGQLLTWGDNTHEMLGDGGKQARAQRPARVQFLDATKKLPILVSSVAFGDTFALAIIDDLAGCLVSWGSDPSGDGVLGLGVNSEGAPYTGVRNPSRVALDEPAARIACGSSHAIVVTTRGNVYGWGCGGAGRLGGGSELGSATPRAVSAPDVAFAVACGAESTVVLVGHEPRDLVTSASRRGGEVGGLALVCGRVASDAALPSSVRLTAAGGDASSAKCIAVAAAGRHALLLTEDGGVLSWGDGHCNGLTIAADAAEPTAMDDLASAGISATAVACGFSTSLVLTSHGNILAWGRNKFGQCGTGTFLKQPYASWVAPAEPGATTAAEAFPLSERFVAVAISEHSSAALVVHDADGVADRTEERERFFAATGRGRAAPATREELRAVFDAFDVDGGGDISIGELVPMLAKLGIASERAEVRRLFDQYDDDGNGVLDFDEFCIMAKVRSFLCACYLCSSHPPPPRPLSLLPPTCFSIGARVDRVHCKHGRRADRRRSGSARCSAHGGIRRPNYGCNGADGRHLSRHDWGRCATAAATSRDAVGGMVLRRRRRPDAAARALYDCAAQGVVRRRPFHRR
jgi:alpha-tubulin suppressor-like RCC1 family protein